MEPLLPEASALGRPRATDLRTVMNAILNIASTGCQWRQLPKDFPPYSTVQGYFYAWSPGGIFASLNYSLVMASREAAGREAIRTILFGMLVTTPGIFALAWMSGKARVGL
jgi:transposase